MTLSSEIAQSVNNLLGVFGQPHYADSPHLQLPTPCMVWELHTLSEPAEIDNKLAEVRQNLDSDYWVAYKSIDWWWGPYETRAHKIVVGPSNNQFDILRFEMGPQSDCEYYIGELRKYDEQYGIDITGAAHQVVEFILKRIPTGEEAEKLSELIIDFDPDIQQTGEKLRILNFGAHKGRIALWFD